jgi:hypothetical protein
MKNLVVIAQPSDIEDHVRSLWKTELFRKSHVTGKFIGDVIRQFSLIPRGFCQTSNDSMERAHFCTWWNVHMTRDDYTNPFIEDLYRLHEIYHAATMPYIPGIGYEAFHRKMEENELKASVASEIRIYFELPELRAEAFKYPIYADRFLIRKDMQQLWRENRELAIETLQELRRDVMFSKAEHEMDFAERWIRRFTVQNRQWSTIWYEHYDTVETHVWRLYQTTLSGDRSGAARAHEDWVAERAAQDPASSIPFRLEAEMFANIYWSNRRKYDAAAAGAK